MTFKFFSLGSKLAPAPDYTKPPEELEGQVLEFVIYAKVGNLKDINLNRVEGVPQGYWNHVLDKMTKALEEERLNFKLVYDISHDTVSIKYGDDVLDIKT
jgi:hypothetical protein